ncbi:MFS transporter [Burkholderia contaminans]|nr:MFS transporter [Burkholderia cenocepacia]RQS90664.1 MFS transporter [Burkholderia contaminans]MBR8250229.1 MFS transporter [Burkholderia cenocepacia]MBR8286540.1 MFS transporter [Burkholderia cenocepacia]MBR8499428.1 MFS transporter [Burkholderia cenocepacia]MDV3101345.1 MFS transporter [Burkholderia cenocepacia]
MSTCIARSSARVFPRCSLYSAGDAEPVAAGARKPAGGNGIAATRAAFFVAGMSVAAWAPLVPYAKERLGVDDAKLGFLLLCLGIGSIGCMPLCQRLVGRFGCRRMIGTGTAMIAIALPLLALMSTMGAMAAALLLFGAGMGMIDVTMNIHAMLVERDTRRRLMSGFHGLFSVGGIAGSMAGGALLSAGAPPIAVSLAVAAVAVALIAFYGRHLRADAGGGSGTRFVLPQGIVAVMGAIALCVFLVEGAMLDWSALFLTGVKQYEQVRAGFGYTVFAIAMTSGRLLGDGLAHRFGAQAIIVAGGILGALGLVVAIAAPSGVSAIIGFGLTGIGCANIVPLLFAAAGRQRAMEPSAAITALSTLGYGGNLAGPAAVGFFAHSLGLAASFALLAALLLAAGIAGLKVAR